MARRVLYQSFAIGLVVAAAPPPAGNGDVLFSQSNNIVPYQRDTIYQAVAQPVPIVTAAAEEVTVDKWHQPLSQPTPRKATSQTFVAYVPQQLALDWLAPLSQPIRFTRKPPETASQWVPQRTERDGINWFAPLSDPTRARPSQTAGAVHSYEPIAAPAETITVDKWLSQLSQPVRPKPTQFTGAVQSYEPIVAAPETITVDKWYAPLSQPMLRKTAPSTSVAFVYVVDTVVVQPPGNDDVRFSQSSLTVRYDKSLLYQAVANPTPIVGAAPAETITVDKWFQQLSLPPDGGMISLDLSTTFFAVEYPFDWYRPLAEPTKRKPLIRSGGVFTYEPTLAPPEVVTLDKWYRPLSEPVRRKPFNNSGAVHSYEPIAPETVTVDKWFSPLNQPVKARPVQHTGAVHQYAPVLEGPITVDKWYAPLSQPYLVKVLGPQHQVELFRSFDDSAGTVTPPAPTRRPGWVFKREELEAQRPRPFNRERWEEMKAAAKAAELAAQQATGKKKQALEDAAKTAAAVEIDAPAQDFARLTALLEQATQATKAAESIRQSLRANALAAEMLRKQLEDEDEDEVAILLL